MNRQTEQLSSVAILRDDQRDRWDKFVMQHADATFFHLSGWREIIGNHLRHPTYYLIVERKGEVSGVLPLARVKSWMFGDALISLPFLVYGGPLGDSPESTKALVDAAAKLAEELGVDYLELRNRAPLTDWPAKNSYVTFRKTMSAEPDENLLAIPRKQRAVVRKAIKAGLTADFDQNVDDLYAILSECKRNLGTPFFSRAYLAAVKKTFGEDCEILNIRHDGQLLSSVMSFRFRNEIAPYYGGGGLAARKFGANDFMYWKVMENACQAGMEVFDFGRSQAGTGAYKFKKYWGFEPEPMSYEYHLVKAQSVPKLDPSNPRYKFLIETWSKLPLGVSRLIGPPLARLLG